MNLSSPHARAVSAILCLAAVSFFLGGNVAVYANTSATGAGGLTVTPSSGDWSTSSNGTFLVADPARFMCPEGTMAGAHAFLTEPGTELPSLAPETLIQNAYRIASSEYNDLREISTNGINRIFDKSLWFADGARAGDVTSALQANHDYSLGLVCTDVKTDSTGKDVEFVQLKDGKPIAVWASLRTDASKNWTIQAPAAPTTVKLTGTASGATGVDLTAEVNADVVGGKATDAQGNVEFFSSGSSIGIATVLAGKATFKHGGLTASTSYKYTAKFTPDGANTTYAPSAMSDEITVSTSATPTQSPTSTATSASPSAADPPTAADSPTTGTSDPTSTDPPAPLSNDPFVPLTGWAASATSTPVGAAGLFALIVIVAASAAFGWNVLLRRRPTRNH